MKIAVISDIHGNLAALESVLESIRQEYIDRIICLGDIVGYGANPDECVDLIRERRIPTILGNHDEAAIGRGDISSFNNYAKQAILWTRKHLKRQTLNFLSDLTLILREDNLLFAHASPVFSHLWDYIFTPSDANPTFNCFQESVCFIGHTHNPCVFTSTGGERRLINVGSVGQPRDHNPLACWGCFDTVSKEYRLKRVEYDVDLSARKIIEADLPPFLAHRLVKGI